MSLELDVQDGSAWIMTNLKVLQLLRPTFSGIAFAGARGRHRPET